MRFSFVHNRPTTAQQSSARSVPIGAAATAVLGPADPADKLTYAEMYNPALRLAYYCSLALIFLRFSFIHELITVRLGIDTHILYIIGPPALFGFLFMGGPQRVFGSRAAWYWTAFTVWSCLAVLF